MFREFTNTSRNPKELEMFNELNNMKLQNIKMLEQQQDLLELHRKKSFDYQIEQYLIRIRDDFQKEFLDKNWYVDLNGETRKERSVRKESENIEDKKEIPKEEKYTTVSYSPMHIPVKVATYSGLNLPPCELKIR